VSAGASGGDMDASAIMVRFKSRLYRGMHLHNEIAPNTRVIHRMRYIIQERKEW